MSPAALLVLLSSAPALGPAGLPAGWEELSFPRVERRTRYQWDADARALRAEADSSASGLIHRLSVPLAERVLMLAARSGDEEAGQWRSEERDLLADYRRLFGEEPPPLSGIALMTDADDTGGSARAWYADVTLSAR